ncbi:hypothetical protein GCM10010331_69360 [Streptomyces xanthochromogenes]|uniref:hypothetical protein n=1 Tax=Streptomyces xanthochromogenes TaxID=67384 RepID=UPI00198BCCE8|nr:hypothetical protein [Streptomyces xanthochromogenes]GHB71566.1 hypothetical protein GCM10010331_69360 [Streptomyces xanthochromogenes]
MPVFVALVIGPLLLLCGLLTIDAFGVLRAKQHADDLSVEAARAAQQAIDPAQAIPGKAFVADPAGASAAARAYLAKTGDTGVVHVTDSGRTVTVTVTGRYPAVFWPTTFLVHSTSSAALLHGITQPDR